MRKFLAIFSRELSALFLSPVAYVTAVVFTAATSWTFLQAVETNRGLEETPEMLLLVSIMVWTPILITVVCMRLFAEEKRSGTLETLMTVAVSERAIVLGKYFGALFFVWSVYAPSVSMLYYFVHVSPGIESVDGYALAGGCIMLALVSAACVAIGLLVSLFTKNQIVAAICCFAAICIPFFVKSIVFALPLVSDRVVDYLSLENQLLIFASGTLNIQVFVLYLSITVLMLFTSIRVLESRRWI